MKFTNKHYLIFTMLAALLVLSACSASTAETEVETTSDASGSDEVVEDTPGESVDAPIEPVEEGSTVGYIVGGEGQLAVEVQLGIGLLRLEQAGFGLTPTQATEQVALWTELQNLLLSEQATEADIAALGLQIQNGLSQEQLNALQAMNLGALTAEELQEEITPQQGPPDGRGQNPNPPEGERPQGERQGGPGQGSPNGRLSVIATNAVIAYLQSLPG